MGQGHLPAGRAGALTLAALLLSPALLPTLAAQGMPYRERWTDMHLELLRLSVQRESAGRDDATLTKVAELLAADDGGVPFRPPAKALALLRDVAADDTFLLRATMVAFVLPEVVDAEAGVEDCRRLNLTPMLPYTLPLPGDIGFELEVLDRAGAVVHRERHDEAVELQDLRMGNVTLSVPGGALADGRYRARLRTLVDGDGPRPGDVVLEHAFSVLRGYQHRAEAVRDGIAAARAKGLPSTSDAVLQGLGLEVLRAYAGEAFDGESTAVADLERAELALQNLAADAPLLRGIDGAIPAALPTGGSEVLSAVFRAPPADAPRRPLVVAIAGAPSFDTQARRPGSPTVRTGRWLQLRIGDLSLGAGYPFAWLQSPGGGIPFAKAMPTALRALHELLPTDGRTVLVLELDAAVALSYAPDVLAEAAAIALVGGGVLTPTAVQRLGATPVLGVPLDGHPSSNSLRYTAEHLRPADGQPTIFELVADRPRPWTFGAAAARAEIARFVRQLPPAK